jgi:hypothetical protein
MTDEADERRDDPVTMIPQPAVASKERVEQPTAASSDDAVLPPRELREEARMTQAQNARALTAVEQPTAASSDDAVLPPRELREEARTTQAQNARALTAAAGARHAVQDAAAPPAAAATDTYGGLGMHPVSSSRDQQPETSISPVRTE